MTTATASDSATASLLQFLNPFHRPAGALDLNPLIRGLVIFAGTFMTSLCVIAFARYAMGYTGELPHIRNLVVVFHVATVTPCVPLGLYLLLARKGDALHKQLGKLWVVLMVITALSTIFIHEGMRLSWIHIFVPLTLRAAYYIIAKARRGDIKGHRNEIVQLYLFALMIPGIFAFALEGRLMNAMLFGWN